MRMQCKPGKDEKTKRLNDINDIKLFDSILFDSITKIEKFQIGKMKKKAKSQNIKIFHGNTK